MDSPARTHSRDSSSPTDGLGGLVGPGLLLGLVAASLVGGAAAALQGGPETARVLWILGTAPVLLRLVVEIVRALRRGDVGLDVVAALAMGTAVALDEALAAAIVALMYSGGTFLEAFAERRASRAMTGLLERAPRFGWRQDGGALTQVPVDEIRIGDRLLVRSGDLVPVDGTAQTPALVDESALTGEPLPVLHAPGTALLSGSTNVGEAFTMRADQPAAASTYAGILRLVEAARRDKAPMVRMADRASLGFLGLTVTIAGLAAVLSGDPIRGLAVLVVATPCPLILAVPIALIAGMDRAARLGVLLKGGRVIEALAAVDRIVLDKTGTLTRGVAALGETALAPGWTRAKALQLAASLDQASRHPVAETLIAAARADGLTLTLPEETEEDPGSGLQGRVEGRRVAVGSPGFVQALTGEAPPPLAGPAGAVTAVAVDGRAIASFALDDPVREETRATLDHLAALGVTRVVLASGDRTPAVAAVGRSLGLSAWHGDLLPADKVEIVRQEAALGRVMMIGDGTNDAPALAAAQVGVALGGRGTAASTEAADVVLLSDRLDRVPDAIVIARKARAIAFQSVAAGLGLSVAAMIAAAFGYLTPVEGALLQEVIDVAVILNALRALAIRPDRGLAEDRAR